MAGALRRNTRPGNSPLRFYSGEWYLSRDRWLAVLQASAVRPLQEMEDHHVKRFGNYVMDLETLPQPIEDDLPIPV